MLLFGQAIIGTMLSLARRCPACRRRQVVPSSRKRGSVACQHCGAPIPPPNNQMAESRYTSDLRHASRPPRARR